MDMNEIKELQEENDQQHELNNQTDDNTDL